MRDLSFDIGNQESQEVRVVSCQTSQSSRCSLVERRAILCGDLN